MMNETPPVTNPFPGLRPFEPHEYHLFFGRDGQSDELLRRLRQNRFVAVVGTSGSGKSSLVRAGLLPSLHGGFMVSAGSDWRVTIFRPGVNPIGNLAESLNREDVLGAPAGRDPAIQRSLVESTLRRGALGLADAVRHAHLPANENLLVIVDQFEEIFRFKHTLAAEHAADDAAAFVKLLLEATRQKDVPVYVIITMRSDFLGDCAQFRDLPEAINDGQYLIPRMTRDQRREAITGPIAVGGADIAPRLINRLLNDVGDNPDQLPILQHALMRTWQQWAIEGDRRAKLDLTHYEAIGGMAEALSRHADKAYDELPNASSKTIAEKLFKLLTERGGDNREIRRPTRLREICAVAEASEAEVVGVIDLFRREGRSFLMPPANVALHDDSLIDISHESLIRGWRRLEKWVDDEALSARIFRRLAETAGLYRAGEAGLWGDPDLAVALAWRERNHPNDAWGARYSPDFGAAMEFLEESQRAQVAKQAERARQRKKTLHLTQALAAVLLIGCLVSLALTIYAFRKSNEAKLAAQNALYQADIAQKARATAEAQTQIAETERAKAETERQKAVAAQEKEVIAKRAAEESARRAEESRLLAVRAKDEAVAAQRVAVEQRQQALAAKRVAEEQRNLAEEHARRANKLAGRVFTQTFDHNRTMLGMANRMAEISTPLERAYWYLVTANAHSYLQQNDSAINYLNEAIKIDSSNPHAFVSRSYHYLLADQPDKAIEDARKAIGLSPSNAAAYQNLVLALSLRSRYPEAEQFLDKGIDSFTQSGYDEYSETDIAPDIQRVTGQQFLLAAGDEALTALKYERATVAAASGADFHAALTEADKRQRSVDAYLFALNWAWLHERFNPKDYGVLAAESALWMRAGFPKEAERAYAMFQEQHAKIRDPRYDKLARSMPPPRPTIASDEVVTDARALAFEATRARLTGRKAPRALFKKAIEVEPTNIDIRMKYAQYLFDNKEFDSARAEFDYVQQRAPQNATARLYYALAGLKSRAQVSPDEISADIKKARDLDPTVTPDLYDVNLYGDDLAARLADKHLEDVVDLFERGTKYSLPTAEPYYIMAKYLHAAGQHERALKKIESAIELRGDRPAYYELREQVEKALHSERRLKSGRENAQDEAMITKALNGVEIGDARIKFGDADGALNAYGDSLKVLDELAKARGVERIHCEAEMILRKISKLAEAKFKRAGATEYLQAMYGDLKGIEGPVKAELKRMSNPY
jgi:tetratricopeptide (TPR) repeat protein